MGLRNTLSSGLPVSSLARSSPVTALRSPWRPLGDQAPLRAKEVLRGFFQSLAYRKEPGLQNGEGVTKAGCGKVWGPQYGTTISGACGGSTPAV